MSDEDIAELREKGLVLYEAPVFHSVGAASGPVQWAFKNRPEGWYKVHGNIMVSEEGTPDMDAAMHKAAGITTLIGGRQSHTAIMAMEFGWVVITGLPDLNLLYNGRKVTMVATKGIIFDGDHRAHPKFPASKSSPACQNKFFPYSSTKLSWHIVKPHSNRVKPKPR